MRWIFLALVLVNIVVFLGYSFVSSRPGYRDASTDIPSSDAMPGDKLILVSELTDEQRQVLDKVKPPAVSNPKPEPAPEVVEVVEPEGEVDPASETAPAPADLPSGCVVLGPAANASQASQLSQRLVAVGIISDVIELDAPGDPEYWVVTPPFANDQAALRKLQELQGRNVSAQVVFKGPLAHTISFGLFGQEQEAEKQAAKIRQLGYRVEVRAVPTLRKDTWILLSERQAPKLSDVIWQGIQADFPKLKKQEQRCR